MNSSTGDMMKGMITHMKNNKERDVQDDIMVCSECESVEVRGKLG